MTVELQPEFPHRTRKREAVEPPVRGADQGRGLGGTGRCPRRTPTTSVSYVELHAHSSYSFLDGASLPEELAVSAAELGYPALALTDHDGVYGSLEFAHAAKHFGVRPITGAEVTLADGSHLTLLVESARGYANLCRLLTAAHAHTRDTTNRDPLPPRLDLALLEELSSELDHGLVCLSGCAR